MLQGVLTQTDIDRVPSTERDQHHVKETMKRNVLVLHADEALDETLEELTTNRVSWAPVVEVETFAQDRRVIGVVSIPQMVRLYRKTLVKDSRRLRGLSEGTIMSEVGTMASLPEGFNGR
jgi:predicted transcriptional regulator